MDLLTQINNIDEILLRKESEFSSVQEELSIKELSLSDSIKDRDSLIEQVAVDTRSSDVIKKIFDTVSSEGFEFLEKMVNQALDSVFQDEDYKFRIKIGSRGNERTTEFLLCVGNIEIPLDQCGGGVQVVVSFVLRAYYILRAGLRRVIFMDETMVQLSPQYLQPFMEFLQVLVDKFGFDFLWISHNSALRGYSKRFYECRKGKLMEEVSL